MQRNGCRSRGRSKSSRSLPLSVLAACPSGSHIEWRCILEHGLARARGSIGCCIFSAHRCLLQMGAEFGAGSRTDLPDPLTGGGATRTAVMSIIDPDEIKRLNGSWLADDIDPPGTREWAEALEAVVR